MKKQVFLYFLTTNFFPPKKSFTFPNLANETLKIYLNIPNLWGGGGNDFSGKYSPLLDDVMNTRKQENSLERSIITPAPGFLH